MGDKLLTYIAIQKDWRPTSETSGINMMKHCTDYSLQENINEDKC